MPKMMVKKIIALQSRFFWSKGNGTKGIPIIKWSTIQLPKEEGGLGVGDLQIKNVAMPYK